MTYVALLTFLHTAISFVAIGIGASAMASLFDGGRFRRWRGPFLATAAITTGTGFIFPFNGPTPAFLVGILATILLFATVLAGRRLPGSRLIRWTYAGGIVANLYLLVFVLIAQAFQKVPALNQFAPTGTEPAFAVTQLACLVAFVCLGVAALRASGSNAASTAS